MDTITRRNFLKASAVSMGGIAASAMLSACGATDENAGADKKKIVRFGLANAKVPLDMQRSTNSLSASISDSICEALLRWDETNKLVPVLLESIPQFEADGVTLPCTLKSGVKFHDGSTLTSADVKYTFERMFTPETAAKSTYMYTSILGADEMLAGKAKELAGFKIQDDTHFTFTLKAPFAAFPSNLAISYSHIFPKDACEKAGKDWGQGTNLIGTGRYKLVSNDETTEVVLARFDDHHDGKPALDEIHYKYFDDLNTKMLAFKNGDIDYCDLDPSLLAQYQADADVKDLIHSYESLGVHFINLNLKQGKGLEDVRVRQALSLAINRQELVDTIASGNAIAAGGWLAPQTPGSLKDMGALEYNPDKAKALLAEAGVTNLKLTAKVRAGLSQKQVVAVQDYWSKIGVDLDVQVEDAGVWAKDWADGNLQITALGWYPLYADGDNHLYTYFYSTSAAKKSSFYNNHEVDALLDKARVSHDEQERADIYKQVDTKITREDYATIPLYWPKGTFVAKPYVKGAAVGNLIYHTFELDVDTSDPNYNPQS
ncbi:ABC transporter substrate-binding protein [Fannyhessea vaginae]|uniref:ABC transporter substrate-binding protein n=1 Tax=Fannyhessea vaginae TaxID=82135 RepID=UPI00065E4BF1|nr:ABC transporter substrate-binding protein [Fannyhessea vaginae]KMT48007.1 ABC transporter substrate-binding protein [Fannyhessea vaginae]